MCAKINRLGAILFDFRTSHLAVHFRIARSKASLAPERQQFEASASHSLVAPVERKSVLGGNARLTTGKCVAFDPAALRDSQGKALLPVAIDGRFTVTTPVSDPVKATSKNAVARLHAMGLEVVLLTVDNRGTADAVAREVGIDRAFAEALPEGKVDELRKLCSSDKVAHETLALRRRLDPVMGRAGRSS